MFLSNKKLFIIAVLVTVIGILSMLVPFLLNRETASVKQASKYMILVDVEANRLYLFEDKICIKQYLVATGKQSTPTPIGLFKIVHKDTWGEGFGGRWMGFDVPWGKLILEYEITTCRTRTSEKRSSFLYCFNSIDKFYTFIIMKIYSIK
ncbi:MAG: L,D-transpeptidase [Ignavibacteriales bacterium]